MLTKTNRWLDRDGMKSNEEVVVVVSFVAQSVAEIGVVEAEWLKLNGTGHRTTRGRRLVDS